MTCGDTERLLDAYVDNELDVRGAVEVEEHLAHCPGCAASERSVRELQSAARAGLTRYPVPQELEARLRTSLGVEAATPPPVPVRAPPISRRRWMRSAAIPFAAAAAIATVATTIAWPRQSEASDAVVSAHVRSLLANHLTDVASSDQHTVKPWFQGKLDYSVAVTDWAAEGFPLVGGRLDYVQDAPAAALVYRRAQHVLNLFIWPTRDGDEPVRHVVRRGYNAFSWTSNGMRHWAVSDLNESDLAKFVQLVRG
jgi:anti-sigma factor RsiW